MFISKYFCLVFHALSIIGITGCQTSFSMTENCKFHWFSDPSSTCTYSALQQVTENVQVNITQSDKIHTQFLIFFQFYFLLNALNCWIQKNASVIILAVYKPPEGCHNPGFGEKPFSFFLQDKEQHSIVNNIDRMCVDLVYLMH